MTPEPKTKPPNALLVALAMALFAAVLSVSWHRSEDERRGLENALNYERSETRRWKDYSQRILAEREADLVRVCGRSQ